MPLDFIEEPAIDFQEEQSGGVDFQPEPITLLPAAKSSEELGMQRLELMKATGAKLEGTTGTVGENVSALSTTVFPETLKKLTPDAQVWQDAIDVLKGQSAGPNSPPGTLAKVGAGSQRAVMDAIGFLTSPAGVATMGTGFLPAAAQRLVAAAFAVDMARKSPEQINQLADAIVSKDPEKISNSLTGLGLTGAFVFKATTHALSGGTPAVTPELRELAPKTAEVLEAKPAPTTEQIDFQRELQAELGSEVASAPSAAPKAEAVTPLEPATQSVFGITPESPIKGVAESIAGTSIGEVGKSVNTWMKAMAGESMPKITAADRKTGELGVRYASSRIAAKPLATLFAAKTLEGTGVDQVKFGAALTEDNLRSVREGFEKEGKTEEAANVATIIGAKGSPFKTEQDYQDFLKEPSTLEAIERHKQQWEDVIEPQYRQAAGIDPNTKLASRGKQTGARINLFAAPEGEPVTKGAFTGRGKLTGSFKRKSPFARKATGASERYEIDYASIIANTFNRQLEIANQNTFNARLVATGNAVVDKPGSSPKLKGEETQAFPLRRNLVITEKDGKTVTFPIGQDLFVRKSLADEYRRAINVDAATRFPVLNKVTGPINTSALASLTDATVHVSNLMTGLFTRPAGLPLADSVASMLGRSDALLTIGKTLSKAFKDNRQQVAELAEIGAMREKWPATGVTAPMGKMIEKADETVRLVLDDTYQQLAEAGMVEKTETARREFVNQVGQYNKRLQGRFTVFMRDTGLGPFITAGKTFNALGLRTLAMSPGVRGSSAGAEAALRANQMSKWVGTVVLVGTLNYLLTKDKGGGVSGRPGVPLGNVDFGTDDKNGRPQSLPVLDILGLGRGLRASGLRSVIEGKRKGIGQAEILDAAVKDMINTSISPLAGPPIRFAVTAATGESTGVGLPRVAPVAPPGQSQIAENLKAAAIEANPLIASGHDIQQGKTVAEAAGRQFPRFTLKPGMTEQKVEDLPKIISRAKLNDYIDFVVREARKLPVEKRHEFVLDKLEKDKLSDEFYGIATKKILQRIKYP